MFGLSIKTKLFAIFATIVLLVGAQSLLALSNLNGLEDSLVFTHKDLLPSVVAAKDMQTSWSSMQLGEAEYVMAKTEKARSSAENEIQAAEAAWKKNSEFYKDLIGPAEVEESERFAKIEKAFDLYKTQISQIAELASSGKADEAAALFSEKMTESFNENLALIQTLVETNDGELKTTLEETDSSSKTALQQTVSGASATLLICVLAMVFSQIGIGRPLKIIAERVRRLAAGDLKGEIRYRGRKDEIGAIANAVQIFRESAVEKERLTGIATQEADTQALRRAALEALIGAFEVKARSVLDSFASAALDMSNTAEILSATAAETSDRGASVAAASEEASANVRSVATAARQLGASVDEISRQAGQSSRIAEQAKLAAQCVNADVATLSNSASAIGNVVSLIADIAGQTNLLALNATIEAARAGESGKGFAIVAAEVKELAAQTAKATERIAVQIANVQSATANAVASIGSIAETIEQVNDIASAITVALQQQLTATQEIDQNVDQAAFATQEVSSNIGSVAQAVDRTEQSASAVLSAAGNLQAQSLSLGQEIEAFLQGVRAA